MRYFIIFFTTLILLFVILFYNPYLGKYDNYVNIKYDTSEEGYIWNYSLDNDSLSIVEENDNHWKFKANKNGKVKLVFKYTNDQDEKYRIEYTFKVKNNKIYWIDGIGYGLLDYPNPY